MIAAPVAARSKLQSDPWVCQFHWPLTEIVTVPLPLSIAVALIVPRIGLLASPNAPATRNVTAAAPARIAAPRRCRHVTSTIALMGLPSRSLFCRHLAALGGASISLTQRNTEP